MYGFDYWSLSQFHFHLRCNSRHAQMEFVRQKPPYGNCEDVSRETNRKHNVYVEKLHEIGYSRAVSSYLSQWFSSWALFASHCCTLNYVKDIPHSQYPVQFKGYFASTSTGFAEIGGNYHKYHSISGKAFFVLNKHIRCLRLKANY